MVQGRLWGQKKVEIAEWWSVKNKSWSGLNLDWSEDWNRSYFTTTRQRERNTSTWLKPPVLPVKVELHPARVICQHGFCQLITDFQQLGRPWIIMWNDSFHFISATLTFPHTFLCSTYNDINKPKERLHVKQFHQGSKPIIITIISDGCGKLWPIVAFGLIGHSSLLWGEEGLFLFETLRLCHSSCPPLRPRWW